MTQPITPWLPGQAPVPGVNYGRLTLPGINDQAQTEERYGLDAPKPPSIGGKWVPPEDINLDAPPAVKPDDVKLDETPSAPKLAGGPLLPSPAAPSPASGWRIKDAKGNVVATFATNPRAGLEYQKLQVQNIGDSLFKQAVTPEEKEAATRATAFGLSLVGSMANDKIQAAIVHRYDEDMGNSTKLTIQEMKTRNRGGKVGAGGPAGPSKADKFQNQLDSELRKSNDGIIESERKGSKYTAISEQENNIAQMDALLASPNAMGQRVAVQRALLELTGKASRESEQSALTGASGKWEELKNKLALWTSDDPQLSAQYIKEFRQMLGVQRQYVAGQKAKIAEAAAQRAYGESSGYPEDQRQLAYSIVKGAMTGNFEGPAAYKPPSSAAPSAPGPNGGQPVSSHLQKYLKK